MRKIKVLAIPSDTVGGVGFYRTFQPHDALAKYHGEEFDVTVKVDVNWKDQAFFEQFDIVNVHKGLYVDMKSFIDCLIHLKDTNTVTVMDLDDSWDLSPTHPQYAFQKQYGLDRLICNNLRIFDYVTTTTELFAKEIYRYNKHIQIFPNAIDPTDERFIIKKPDSDRVRVGFIMGSTHEHDLKLIGTFINKLPKETIDKMQIVLCGFDTRGIIRGIDPKTGKEAERSMQPMETVWYRYEKMLTDNYKYVDDKYKKFLHMFISQLDYPNVSDEVYRRCWTKDINHYYSHYNNVDLLLAPLETKMFNYVKSELKAVECCFSHTALIASDFGPYSILDNAIDLNGEFNGKGNAILIDETKNDTDWVKYIDMLINDPVKLKTLQDNIYNSLHVKYDLRTVTNNRADFYKNITKFQWNK